MNIYILSIVACIILVILGFFILGLDKIIVNPLIVKDNITSNTIEIESNTIQNVNNTIDSVKVQENSSLFFVSSNKEDYVGKTESGVEGYSRYILTPKEENRQLYDSLGPKNANQTTVVIVPMFTFLAYSNHGFYDYFAGQCDKKCLTVSATVEVSKLKFGYSSSEMAYQVFGILGYDLISDVDVDKDPSLLKKYDRVILLHNEYVTKKMFDAITHHPKVIYLYPNALHAEVLADYENNSITLLRGHGYPEKTIENGFDWKYDNTHPYEFDNECKNQEFYKIDNGFMLNCYPENIIYSDIKLLQIIRDL